MYRMARRKFLVLKKWVRILIIATLMALACFSVVLIYSGLNPKIEKTPYYNYNIHRDIDYKVYLKPNNFYEEEYIGEGKQYTSALIDYIDINFNFLYDDSENTNYEYSYDVKGTIIGEYEDSKSEKNELWAKKYDFVDITSESPKGVEFSVHENIKIKYDEFDKIVNDFKANYKLAIDAYLNVKMTIRYKSVLDDNEEAVNGEDELEINIPLSKAAIKLTTNYDDDTSKSLIVETKNYNLKEIYIGVCLLIIVIMIFSTIKSFIFVNNKSDYRKTMEKILKDYSEIIAETNTPIEYSGLTIYDINEFDDLVDVEEELKSPILLYEEIPGRLSYFVIINDSYAYRFVLDINNMDG